MTTEPRPFITPARIKAPGASIAITVAFTLIGIVLVLIGFAAPPAAVVGGLLLAIASGIAFRNFIRNLAHNIEQRLIDIQFGNGQIYKPKDIEVDTNRRQFEG